MGSDGERWGGADEASLTRPPLTSCCSALVLTGHRPVGPRPRGGDPCHKQMLKKYEIISLRNKCQAMCTIPITVLHLLDVYDGWYIFLRIIGILNSFQTK